MELNPKINNEGTDNLDSRLDKVIEKTNIQSRILRKILNQLNKTQGEGEGNDQKKTRK